MLRHGRGLLTLRDHFERSGNWLFRRRSYLPLFLLAILLPAVATSSHPGGDQREDYAWEAICLAISLAGLAIRVLAISHAAPSTSGRGTEKPVAAALNTAGLYSIMRHPLYVGNYLMWLGVMMLPRVWWCPVLGSLAFFLYYERIAFAEEEFLRRRFGDAWETWAARTPAFAPAFHLWQPPMHRFSIRHALRREYSALFGLIASFTFLEIVSGLVHRKQLEIDPVWGIAFLCTAVAYIVLRTLKRSTRLLHVPDR
jgi:protein-S-isoprenylcysteine O-methyltransferase Ste14